MPKSLTILNEESLTRKISAAQSNLDTQMEAMSTLRAEISTARQMASEKPARYQALCQAYDRQYEAVCRAEDSLERLVNLDRDDSYWSDRARELQEHFTDQYGDRGPQYEVLIRRLVFAEISVEQLEKSGRNFDTGEWRGANKAVLDAIQALQKYTESQKSEMIQTAQQRAMLVIMEIAERVIAPKYPEAWARVVEEIERQLPAGDSYE